MTTASDTLERDWTRRPQTPLIHELTPTCASVCPSSLVRMITRSDGHEVPIYSPAHLERVRTKRTGRSEIRPAAERLQPDPLTRVRERGQRC